MKELGFNPPLRFETYQCEVGDGVAQDDELQEETNLDGRTTIPLQALVVDHIVSEDIQLKAEESKLVNCHMGETLPTMEGIRKHCQFTLESNQPPFTQAGRGLQRKHMKNQSTSHHVLSFDLMGPHPAACELGYVYGLVGVYYVERPGENIPFVRGLKRKTAEEVSKAIKSILLKFIASLVKTLS